MRYLKMLSLSAVVAAILMALAGPASAETTVCKVTEEPCSAGNSYPVGTEIEAVSIEGEGVSKPTLTSPFGNISCNITMKGKNETTTTPSGKAFSLTFTSCVGGTAEMVTLGSLVVHHDAEHNGRLSTQGTVVKVVQAGVTCYYSAEIESTGTGGETRIIHTTANPKRIMTAPHSSSFFCPESAPFHATYKVTKPSTPGYVTTGV